MNNWKKIWEARNLSNYQSSEVNLETLINLDGFDGGAGRIKSCDWLEYASLIVNKLGISKNQSVYEVGCGSGAFLFALKKIVDIDVSGSDYSKNLIKVANEIFNNNFECIEAKKINVNPKYDFVVSNGVFHYFDLEYALKVLGIMVQKAKKGIAILEIPDFDRMFEAEEIRKDTLPYNEYIKKYAGLNHTYYKRQWFADFANKNNLEFEIMNQFIPNYIQSSFRFNVFLKKFK